VQLEGRLSVQPAPPPNGSALSLGERAARLALLAMPGRLARAARLAAGYESG